MVLTYIKQFLKLIRWFHELLAVLPFVALYFIINYELQKSGKSCEISGFNFIILCVCVQLLIAAGCVLNDIMDRNIDKINKPQTHIIGQYIALNAAKTIFVILTFLIICFSVYISYYMFKEWAFVCIGVYILSVIYNVYLKKSPLFGNILIALLASFIPLVIFLFAGDCIKVLGNEKINTLIWLYAIFPFLIIVPRELSLDISDLEGDKACGCKTLPIVIGVKKAKWVTVVLILIPIILSVFVALKFLYLTFSFVFVDVLLIYYLYKLKSASSRLSYIRIGRFLWFIMIVGLICFSIFTIL